MSAPVVVSGLVLPDGRLELCETVPLPPGPVQVTVQPVPMAPPKDFLEFTAQLRAAQAARGHVPRSVEEIDAEFKAIRDESEEELLVLEAIHEQSAAERKARRDAGASS